MPRTHRTLQLKCVEFRQPENIGFVFVPLHEMLMTVAQRTTRNRERHVPLMDADILPGTRCSFIDNIGPAPSDVPGVTFRFAAYRKGDLPLGLNPDWEQNSAEIAPCQLTDVADGTRREPLLAFHVLAFGEVLIAEFTRGTGGIGALEICLNALIRRHVDADHATTRRK